MHIDLYVIMSLRKAQKKNDKTILAITDFSKSSTNAILFAARLFKNYNLKLNLLNVFENPSEKAALLISIEDIVSKDSELGLKKQSEEIAYKLEDIKPQITTNSLSGKFKKVVGTITQSENIDLIVAGIPLNQYPCKELNYVPFLFVGQSKFPILMVPEDCVSKSVKNILVLSLDVRLSKGLVNKGFEYFANHHSIDRNIINLNDKKVNNSAKLSSLFTSIKENKVDLLMIIPSAGDKIDRALLDYQVQELCPTVASLLNC